jgi:protein involved in polysaccharide export with SLBB domain
MEIRIFMVFFSAIAFAALAFGQTEEAAPLGRAVPEDKTATSSNHVLAPNESIQIKVFNEPDLDTSLRIAEDGKISFPLIGELNVGGLTVQKARALLRDKLAARFLVNPQVSITVVEMKKRLFTVLGQVQRPGTYRFPDHSTLSLVEVVGIAGGYTRLANPSRITVKRQTANQVFKLDGKRMASDPNTKPFNIQAGDIITVGERLF